jgi:hypothetical protein
MNAAKVLEVLEGLGLTADDLSHLAHLARERERARAEEHTAHLAELMWDRPALGYYRRPSKAGEA